MAPEGTNFAAEYLKGIEDKDQTPFCSAIFASPRPSSGNRQVAKAAGIERESVMGIIDSRQPRLSTRSGCHWQSG
jgi:hypothetical protein